MNSVPDTHDPRTEFLRLYQEALRKDLQQSPTAGMESAWELGRHAMALGLETLDMARIHEIALVTLVLPHESSSSRTNLLGCAGLFFAEVITPIEQTHTAAHGRPIPISIISSRRSTSAPRHWRIRLRSYSRKSSSARWWRNPCAPVKGLLSSC